MINSDKPDNPMTDKEMYVAHIAKRFMDIRESVDALEEQFRFVLSNYLNSNKNEKTMDNL